MSEPDVSQESVADSAAIGDTASNIDSSATETGETQTQTATDDTQASTETAETTQEAKPDVDDPKIPSQFRDHLKELESDIKVKYKPAMAGLEKAATDLYGANTPEDVQATIQTVQALAPTLKVLTDPQASQADVVAAVQKMLPQEHVEAVAWAALNDPVTQEVIFSDPDVLQTISEKLFGGKSLEEVQSILANAPVAEVDPKYADMERRLKANDDRIAKETSESTQRAAQEQSTQLMTRFFETPAQTVIADDFKLVAPEGASEADKQLFADTAEDIRYAAQGRFLKANMDAYMQIDSLYRQGRAVQAQTAEIRLANRYHATLIKVAERNANLLKSRSVTAVNDQQTKINGVRPDATGSVDGNGNKAEERWDIRSPDFAQTFAKSFHN